MGRETKSRLIHGYLYNHLKCNTFKNIKTSFDFLVKKQATTLTSSLAYRPPLLISKIGMLLRLLGLNDIVNSYVITDHKYIVSNADQ